MITSITNDLVESIMEKYGPSLKKINLSRNGLREIGLICSLSNCLEKLDLSENDLIDIRPIGGLRQVEELNLQSNNIENVNSLSNLKELKTLDLSLNCISTLDSIRQLSQCESLSSLNLSGNPICEVLGYPIPVFSVLPSIKVLDGLDKDAYFSCSYNQSALSTGHESEHVDRRRSSSSSSSSSEKSVSFLETQLHCLEEAFVLQESAVVSSGLKVARNSITDSSEDRSTIETFPYVELLQLWRRTAFENQTKLSLSLRENEKLQKDVKTQRNELNDKLKESQLSALSWKERMKQAEDVVKNKENSWKEIQNSDKKSKDSLLEQNTSIKNLRYFLIKSIEQMDTRSIGALLEVEAASAKLQKMQERVEAAGARVSLAATMVAQKEVRLRNTAAIQLMQSQHLHINSPSQARNAAQHGFISEDVEESDVVEGESAAKYQSLDSIRPEVEALLRSVYRRLDSDDSGIVSRQLLLVCFGASSSTVKSKGHSEHDADNNDDDDEDKEEEEDDEIEENEDGNEDSLASILQEVLGQSQWNSLVGSLQASHSSDVTWGELLLHLVTAPGTVGIALPSVDLDSTDYDGITKAGAWGDIEWGMLPLDLSNLSLPGVSELATYRNDPEKKRLVKERAYLMNQLHEMGRTLERRAETIKAYFHSDAKRSRLREKRLQAQIAELKSSSTVATQLLDEMKVSHNEVKQRLEDRCKDLESDMNAKDLKLSAVENSIESNYELKLMEERGHYKKLEGEYSLLQREMSKKEVLLKGHQRDTARMQSSLTKSAQAQSRSESELARTDDQLTKVLQERDDLESLSIASQEEIETLKSQVQSLEMQNENAKSASINNDDEVGLKNEGVCNRDVDSDLNHVVGQGQDENVSIDELRQQVHVLRNISRGTGGEDKNKQEFSKASASAPGAHSDVYASHLNKLLKLAEDAINSS